MQIFNASNGHNDHSGLLKMNHTLLSIEELSEICPPELKSQYLALKSNMQQASINQHNSNEQNQQEELDQLEIKLQYPANLEDLLSSNAILIRHAFAWHNYYKRIYGFDNRRVFSNDLVDPPLHYFGIKQCEILRTNVNQIDFSVVYISPMRRTLETAMLVFCDHPKRDQIKFKLLPIANEKISSQYSTFRWSRFRDIQSIKWLDLSEFDRFQNKELWQFEMLQDYDNPKPDLEEIKANLDKEDLNLLQQDFLIQNYAKLGIPISFETEESCYKRGIQIKELLRQEIKNNEGTNKKVCLVSHSVLIKTLFCHGLDEERKIIKDPNFYLENGNITGIKEL